MIPLRFGLYVENAEIVPTDVDFLQNEVSD